LTTIRIELNRYSGIQPDPVIKLIQPFLR